MFTPTNVLQKVPSKWVFGTVVTQPLGMLTSYIEVPGYGPSYSTVDPPAFC